MDLSSVLVNVTTNSPPSPAVSPTVNYFTESDSTSRISGETIANVTLECKAQLNDGALYEFITLGILLNVVGVFGLFGNIISMIILSRPQMKSSINYLLIGLARCDTILIITSVLIHGLPAIYSYTGLLFNYKFKTYPRIVRYLYPLSCMAQMVTVYLTLTVTMERYVAVCHPLKARSFCTYGRARLAVLCIVIVSILYNLPKFWEVNLEEEIHWRYNVTVYCVVPAILRSSDLYIKIYVNWMYFFVYYAFPFVMLVVFNVAIYRRVRKANRDLQQLSRHQRREINLATMLLCVVIVFIVCNVLPLVSNVFEMFRIPPAWLVQTGNLLVTINSSINFIVYVIFGRNFKRLFIRLFCSSRFFRAGRDSPEFQTNDESVVTNMTNIELKNSIRRNHLHRSNTTVVRANNLHVNGSGRRQSVKILTTRASNPGPCVYYPANTSPSANQNQVSINYVQNGWSQKNNIETVIN
ncbi:FMRFamide receptor [Microplitis demolitor]|uniref:FMRFamide receptor n=1 Tax=Microplitis demolitor TaxID=69319 RepID=UPI0004CD4E33|nr:FMRFamide receptor [Microplitis demolitor]